MRTQKAAEQLINAVNVLILLMIALIYVVTGTHVGEVTVTATVTNAAGESKTTTKKITTSPDAPGQVTGLSATSPVPLNVTLTWVAPETGGADITYYKWQYRKEGSVTWLDGGTVSGSEHTATFSVPAADAGSEYEVRVRAANSAGDGVWSSTATVTITPEPADPETPPEGEGP